MNLNAQDYLAKLLAKENLTVQHGNYSTASFNVVDRILNLPLWADKGKAVYDLLVGHEVGHALYTPADGWHDSEKEIPGVPRAYINIIEDIRIEKKIQRTYPGITRSFKIGYKRLFDDNLFGTEDKDINKMSFMDRLNVHSKGRGYVDVQFTDIEQRFVDMAMAVETWDDVLKACLEINDFVKNEEDYEDDDTETTSEIGDKSSEDGQEMESTDGSGEATDGESEETEGDADSSDTLTDDAQRENEGDLLDTDDQGKQNVYSCGISNADIKAMIIDYPTLLKERMTGNRGYMLADTYENVEATAEFTKFLKDSKATVSLMAKDFERKKAAFEYSRSSEAKKGSLNVNKLHQYQYSEDIFLTVQQLAQAQSHGIIMMIDQSGSMSSTFADVVKQTLTIALFCKRVNIPFEAWTYTTGRNLHVEDYNAPTDRNTNKIADTDRIKLVNVLNSNLKKKEFLMAARHLYVVAMAFAWRNTVARNGLIDYDSMGGTPTVQSLIAMETVIQDFKRRNPVQNINLMLLTDGMADSVSVENTYRYSYNENDNQVPTNHNISFKFRNQLVTGDTREEVVAATIKALKKLTGAKVTGFFISENNKHSFFSGWTYFAAQPSYGDIYTKAFSSWKKVGLATLKNIQGMDDFFIVKTNAKSNFEEFEVTANKNGKDTQIKDVKRQFRKFNQKKKQGKVLVDKITDAIAIAA